MSRKLLIPRRRLILDADDSLRDTMGTAIMIYKREVDPSFALTQAEIKSWDLTPYFPLVDAQDFFFRQHAREVFVESKPIDKDVAERMERLFCKYEIFIASHQQPGNEKYTYEWFRKYNLPFDYMSFVADKSSLGGFAALDDKIENLQRYRDAGIKAVCMDRGWNREWMGYRVFSFAGFENLLNFYEKYDSWQ